MGISKNYGLRLSLMTMVVGGACSDDNEEGGRQQPENITVEACIESAPEVHTSYDLQWTVCGSSIEWTPINQFEGVEWVQEYEDAVVYVSIEGGNCTGTLIDIPGVEAHLVLTAGHCVEEGEEIEVLFNFEELPDGPEVEIEGVVVEQSDTLDFALIRLAESPNVQPVPLGRELTSELFIIQHPRMGTKVIGQGELANCSAGLVSYFDIDTLVGSSGAGVFNTNGELVAVHTLGRCERDGSGDNAGYLSALILEASSIMSGQDIAKTTETDVSREF